MTEIGNGIVVPEGSSSMRAIAIEEFKRPTSVVAGVAPSLKWIRIEDLLIDESYQRPIAGKGRRVVHRIARSFSWSCFSPVVVAALEGGKFAIIDGQHRTTAAAVVGIKAVPCQVVSATREEQAVAFKAINDTATPVSRMEMHAAGVIASDECAVKLAEICAHAEVQLLRYPVPVDRQVAGQTMAIGAITQCLRRYGEETLITTLQCITQTTNNKPGMLSARMIKALCAVLHEDQRLRDSGLALLDAFDAIDLMRLQETAATTAAGKEISAVDALVTVIRQELRRHARTAMQGRADRTARQSITKYVRPDAEAPGAAKGRSSRDPRRAVE